ncbi:polysaccharide biosynthesis protein [Clostridium tagluense]|uniref:putative polysaccharide biosynthesis protein n=1 Tax=Clostridium tagluense TaxID=360422 RepID=UPI001CF4D7A1|nr:polysaccharide biosynthesis protein [Clostridium tagluense]MCB2311571.1 polysaccharide biosynthesis protein [Clostridium tagluense]MCB2316295.1 polysaccharide biosynthesis protein [Clostridium tagluense]MCB2321149.1 polysaccharide biosynthesis protein [Clostridium tagluense]MCB2326164.1 polysaccharide biosynthesis protein [Clostridium tagluense]MCB2330887.1 polysaccharide biosynthesis protein [Clostridium tagluense]
MSEKANLEKQSTTKGFAILSAAGFMVKLLSLLYVPFLNNILGKQGYGVYSSAYSIFVYMYILTNAGIPVAISKMVSELIAIENYKDAVKTFKIARFLLLILGMIMSILMIIFAAPLANKTASSSARLAIMSLAPTILISSVLSAYRGYFQGRGNMTPTAVSQVLEQIANTIFSLAFAAYFIRYGIAAGAAGGTIGTSVGALVAVLYMIYFYEKNKVFRVPKGYNKLEIKRLTTKKLIKKLLSYSVPMTVCLGIQQSGLIIDLWLVKSRMIAVGIDKIQVDVLWGVLNKYTSLISVPIAIISSLAITILPSISSLMVLRDKKAVRDKVNYAFRLCFLVAVPSAVGLAVLAKPIIGLLKYDSDVSRLLIYGSVIIILMAVVAIQTSILQGLGKLYLVTIYAVVGLIGKTVTNYIFVAIPSINILGAVMANGVSFAILLILNYSAMNKVLRVKINLFSHAIKPIIASGFMAIVAKLMYGNFNFVLSFVREGYFANAIAILIAMVFAILTYFFTLVMIGGITKEDLGVLPHKIKKLIPKYILNKIR